MDTPLYNTSAGMQSFPRKGNSIASGDKLFRGNWVQDRNGEAAFPHWSVMDKSISVSKANCQTHRRTKTSSRIGRPLAWGLGGVPKGLRPIRT